MIQKDLFPNLNLCIPLTISNGELAVLSTWISQRSKAENEFLVHHYGQLYQLQSQGQGTISNVA